MATAENKLQQSSVLMDPLHQALRNQLEHRRQVLAEAAASRTGAEVVHLLHEVDAALNRLETGTYGICDVCHEAVGDEQLLQDPLVRLCLDHLAPEQQRALERDLELASRIQARLLPRRDFRHDGWSVAYHYKPHGVVSGDYCDIVAGRDGDLHFMVGDVSGKGVAASMLMSNLNAIFRTLVPLNLPLPQLMERANRVFTGSTLPTQYATLVCGRATADGRLEVANAGHLPALVVKRDAVHRVESQSMPMGLFAEQTFTSSSFEIAPGDSLLLFSDGISEAQNGTAEYGETRLAKAALKCGATSADELITACVRDLAEFLGTAATFDDETLMVIQRSH